MKQEEYMLRADKNLTWGTFKHWIEEAGVTDNMEIGYLDIKDVGCLLTVIIGNGDYRFAALTTS